MTTYGGHTLDDIEAAARAAHDLGPWIVDEPGETPYRNHPMDEVYDWVYRDEDRAHIATADPATVLALVARVRLAERMMSSLRALEAYPYLHMIPVEIFHALREARQAYDALGEG